MRTLVCRWFLFGLLLGWALTHATVFGQQAGKTPADKPTQTPADKIRTALDKTVTIDYTGQSVAEALNHFREKVGVPINVDSVAHAGVAAQAFPGGAGGDQVVIKGTNEKAGAILRRFLNAEHLTYVIVDDAILVTSEEAAVARQMRQKVSVDLSDVPLKKAMRELAKNHGVNLVIDPKVATQADTQITLQLDRTSMETALRLMAEMASLKAVRMGNVMFITSEEKANKIRAEEKHQFDTPLNPSVATPGGFIFGGGGGFAPGGGGFGGRAGGGGGFFPPAMPVQKIVVPQGGGGFAPGGGGAPLPPRVIEPVKKGVKAPPVLPAPVLPAPPNIELPPAPPLPPARP